jgi:hypothetical protein
LVEQQLKGGEDRLTWRHGFWLRRVRRVRRDLRGDEGVE